MDVITVYHAARMRADRASAPRAALSARDIDWLTALAGPPASAECAIGARYGRLGARDRYLAALHYWRAFVARRSE